MADSTEFHSALDSAIGESSPEDLAVIAVKLHRYDGLVAGLDRAQMALLKSEVALRLCEVAGANAKSVDLNWGVFATCLNISRFRANEAALFAGLKAAFKKPILLSGELIFLPVNIGVARYPEHGGNGRDLTDSAWLATQAGCRYGEDRCQFFDHAMAATLKRKRLIEHALRRALLQLEPGSAWSDIPGAAPFEVMYQPKVDLDTLRISGVEALVRWNDPEIGAGPDEFIAIAEETGLIVPLGRWIVQRAIHHHQKWRRSGIALTLAINVSPIQLSSQEAPLFPEFMARQIQALGVDPKEIEIEITEGVMTDPNARAAIDELSGAGLRITVDDFGKYYSNLAILASLPASTLKIDKEFVDDIVNDDRKRIVAEQVVALARSLGMRSIMEGVESPEQLEILSTLGCDEVQGYVFSRPISAETVPLAQANVTSFARRFSKRRSYRKPTSYSELMTVIGDAGTRAPPRMPGQGSSDLEARQKGQVGNRIILIDDHADLCEAAAIGLERQGYQVSKFIDPLRALSAIARDPNACDLVITDESMPGMRGLQLLQAIKQLRSDLPVILWTGFSGDAPEHLARAAGADGYLQKPAPAAKLSKEVRRLLTPDAAR